MNQHILYNFASRNRPAAFYSVIDNIRKLSANKNYTVLLKLDTTDKTNYDEAKLALYYPEVTVIRHNHKEQKHVHADLQGARQRYAFRPQ